MRDVILQISEAEKQFEDFLVVGGIAIHLALCESVDGIGGVGQEPCQHFFVDQARFDAASAQLIGAVDYHLDEMIEADAFGRERRQDFFPATVYIATPTHSRFRLPCP